MAPFIARRMLDDCAGSAIWASSGSVAPFRCELPEELFRRLAEIGRGVDPHRDDQIAPTP